MKITDLRELKYIIIYLYVIKGWKWGEEKAETKREVEKGLKTRSLLANEHGIPLNALWTLS